MSHKSQVTNQELQFTNHDSSNDSEAGLHKIILFRYLILLKMFRESAYIFTI